MSLVGVVIAGTLGSWFGSAIMYWVARWLGRAAMLRWGKYFLVPPDKFARAEVFMHRYEAGGIFFARLLPVIRHLISIPAGIIRMGFVKFSILTLVGAGVWCSVLAWLGRASGRQTDARATCRTLMRSSRQRSPNRSRLSGRCCWFACSISWG